MKKILLTSLVMLLTVSMAYSQFGIKGGISLAKIGGDDSKQTFNLGDYDPTLAGIPPIVIEPKTKVGFVAGISYKINLILGLAIQPEVLYIQKGAIYESSTISLASIYPGASIDGKVTIKLDYIDIPILVKYSLPIPVISPYIEGGVSYGILVSAKFKEEATINGVPGVTQPPSQENDIKDQMKKSDLSIQLGVGVEFTILEVDARYVMGLSKLDKDGNAKAYNRGIVLTSGLRF
jgi:hypothetical protein